MVAFEQPTIQILASPMLLCERFPNRATSWQLKDATLHFGSVPVLMGIVNVTPDSFSDGGKFDSIEHAVEHAMRLVAEGAGILDIGGESTRPNADPVSEGEELRRVVRVVQSLAEQTDCPISIDTSKAKVAQEAVAAGAQIINDVTGLEGDPRMLEVALATECGVCAMHMRGTPKTMLSERNLQYDDVVEDVFDYLKSRRNALLAAGMDPQRICLDPGIGFAKSHQQNLTLLADLGRYHDLGVPLLVGHSKKGFLAKILGNPDAERTYATVGVCMSLAALGIQVIRVHDVLPANQALRSFAAVGGIDGQVLKLD